MSNNELRDKVIELEPYPEDLKERIREEILHTRKRPHKTWERRLLVFGLFLLVALLIFLGVVIWGLIESDIISRIPKYYLVILAVSVLFMCWLLIPMLKILKRGTEVYHKDSLYTYSACGFFTCIVMAFNLPVTGLELGLLILAGVFVICTFIYSSELRLRERVLRNELALAELAELVTRRDA